MKSSASASAKKSSIASPPSGKTASDAEFRIHLIQRGLSEATVRKYLREWAIVKAEAFGGKPPASLHTAAHKLRAYLRSLERSEMATQTVRRRLQVTKRYYEACGHAKPLKGVQSPRKPVSTTMRTLTDEQADRLLEALANRAKDAHEAYQLVLLTGMRLSEVIAVRYTPDDLKIQRLRVVSRGRERFVVIGKQAALLLRRRLYAHDKWHKKPQWYADHLRLAALDAGLGTATAMDLRYTYAARMVLAGHPIAFVTNNMGIRSDPRVSSLIDATLEHETCLASANNPAP